MKVQFNEAQLSRPQLKSLNEVLDVLQAENEIEIIVTPVEFPLKLRVLLDNDVEMLLGWDADKQSYAGLTTPERLEQDIKDLASETIPESEKDTVDLPAPEPTPETEMTLICCLDMDGKVIKTGLDPNIDPIELARLKYELMSTHLNMPVEQKIIFNKEYARLWSEHK